MINFLVQALPIQFEVAAHLWVRALDLLGLLDIGFQSGHGFDNELREGFAKHFVRKVFEDSVEQFDFHLGAGFAGTDVGEALRQLGIFVRMPPFPKHLFQLGQLLVGLLRCGLELCHSLHLDFGFGLGLMQQPNVSISTALIVIPD